ncbi:MAG: DUF2182 domain-containing protein [Pseudomonadales bacterium]|nr:DUF2182 domain-containing protein [Pseudomonadales bacterium]
MTMNMQPVATWDVYDLVLLYMMWAIMMAGMMLPSAMPVILLVEQLNQKRLQRQASYTPTVFFAFGYLLIWCLYSLLATVLQYMLHHWALLNPMMSSANHLFSASILIAAGLYQFTPIKQRCLQLCQSPLGLLSRHWQEHTWGAVRLGLIHGQYCLGCCWVLMGLLFVAGVMNLLCIALLTALVLLEKGLPRWQLSSHMIGSVLIFTGMFYAFAKL